VINAFAPAVTFLTSYQPAQWENPKAIKTRELLATITNGSRPRSSCLSEHELDYLRSHIKGIELFDSMDSAARPIPRDALAVIRKL
jgi:hypothetical protein